MLLNHKAYGYKQCNHKHHENLTGNFHNPSFLRLLEHKGTQESECARHNHSTEQKVGGHPPIKANAGENYTEVYARLCSLLEIHLTTYLSSLKLMENPIMVSLVFTPGSEFPAGT